MKVYLTLLSKKEYQEAVAYYDEQSRVVGDKFIAEVEEAIDLIRYYGLAWPKVTKNLRRYVLKRFPYMMLYKIYKDRIVIFAIAHQHRHPSYYLKRTS